jgi:N-acetyl-gamma-glutamylphosphate reductase
MGFDLYGERPTGKGDYFRANVWYWRPIWSFVCEVCSDILTEEDFKRGQYNDNHLIEEDRAKDIAKRLREKMDLAREKQKQYETEAPNKEKFNKMLEDAGNFIFEKISKPKSKLINCPGDMQTHDPENYERWKTLMHSGNIQFDEMSYPINAKVIEEFAEFAEHSGGFRIN